ncbi:MAG TPA: hypothetical protein VMR41_05515 [Patescibacteria group bacterium]|nr:hypothetical protein [Patescibacteria group bacterium]
MVIKRKSAGENYLVRRLSTVNNIVTNRHHAYLGVERTSKRVGGGILYPTALGIAQTVPLGLSQNRS